MFAGLRGPDQRVGRASARRAFVAHDERAGRARSLGALVVACVLGGSRGGRRAVNLTALIAGVKVSLSCGGWNQKAPFGRGSQL